MRIVRFIVVGAWLAFFVVWIVAALSAKRSVNRSSAWPAAAIRVTIALVAVWLFRTSLSAPAAPRLAALPSSFSPAVTGAALTVAGIAWAIWARIHIGRNWGMPMSRQPAPDLVTSGPYRLVRHPIYSGVLLAMLGSALASGFSWLLMLVPFAIYFVFSATREEQFMLQRFGDRYSTYKQRTKMLVPFIF